VSFSPPVEELNDEGPRAKRVHQYTLIRTKGKGFFPDSVLFPVDAKISRRDRKNSRRL
jgi:hypothetical protein